ncbi:MAG: PIN domain-containing protein [Armatimonadetes bacterium]|nr:PIN domain-containing protein [Armatimonadota bacterium]
MIVADTDVMVDLLRRFPPAMEWLGSLDDRLVLPGFVVMELIAGCKDRTEQRQVERIIRPFPITWPTREALNSALSVFADHHLGHAISMLDAVIGQTAAHLGLPLATFNRKHYSVIHGLKTVQPYSRMT